MIVFIHGSGGNGKSVFLNSLTYILGDYATQAPMSTFLASNFDRHPTEVAALQGARVISASETGEGGRWHEARLKSISGGDPIKARFLYGDFFTFIPKCKLVLVGNHKPQLQTVDEAMRRRLHLVPFIIRPLCPDPDLAEKLKTEAPAILAWMVEGCLAWQRAGLRPPNAVVAATQEYFEDQDALGRWLTEECEREPGNREVTSKLFAGWEEWARTQAEDPGTARSFSDGLVRLGFKRWKQSRSRRAGFRGLTLKPRQGTDDALLDSLDVPGVPPSIPESRTIMVDTSPLEAGDA